MVSSSTPKDLKTSSRVLTAILTTSGTSTTLRVNERTLEAMGDAAAIDRDESLPAAIDDARKRPMIEGLGDETVVPVLVAGDRIPEGVVSPMMVSFECWRIALFRR